MTVHKTISYDVHTQTPNNDTIEQLINTNGFYRIKLIRYIRSCSLFRIFVLILFSEKIMVLRRIVFIGMLGKLMGKSKWVKEKL